VSLLTAPAAARQISPIGTANVPSRVSSGLWVVIGCVVLAGLSLVVLPREIAYDPWSWLIWGREMLHLDLDTRDAATAVKPLPIFIDTLLAVTGSAAPVLWLLVARTSALLALALAFRLGYRLAGVGAGLVAAVGLAVSAQYISYLFIAGMSEPMAAAAVLAAVEFHLQNRRRAALAALVAAGLLRPEAWPFLIAYCFWLSRGQSALRRTASVVAGMAVVAVWFVIDWFGSRQFFRSAGAATHESQGGPLLSREPGLATLRETWHLMSVPIEVLFLLGLGSAFLAWRRTGRPSTTLWIGLGAIGWVLVDAVLAQGRFATGAARYLLPGVALAAVVAGVFVMEVSAVLTRALSRRERTARAALVAPAAVAVCVVATLVPRFVYTGRSVHIGVQVGQRAEHLMTGVREAITLAGGRHRVVSCGPVSTQAFQVPLVAWELRVPVGTVTIHPSAPGTVFQQGVAPRVPADLLVRYRDAGSVGAPDARWTVLTTCPARG
jgi:hypothetical protein